ncbi:MAG TPA: V-type ATPase subunit subunit G family protein [Methanocella sp.]|nr:V-type ATPase subunit subunit G family protein [Methanocella sp.]
MAETKSLLRQIRDKETDLNLELDRAARESEGIIEAAKKDAVAIVRSAEIDGDAAAADHTRKEREALEGELAELQARGLIDAAAVRKRAEGRMARAVEKIVDAVALRNTEASR